MELKSTDRPSSVRGEKNQEKRLPLPALPSLLIPSIYSRYVYIHQQLSMMVVVKRGGVDSNGVRSGRGNSVGAGGRVVSFLYAGVYVLPDFLHFKTLTKNGRFFDLSSMQ